MDSSSQLLADLAAFLDRATEVVSASDWPNAGPANEESVWLQAVAATSLSYDLAYLLRSTVDRVYSSLTRIPDNMLSLLHSPQGWTALAGYVAADLGTETPDYRPTVH